MKAQEKYHLDPGERNREVVAEKKKLLQECYGEVEGEFVAKKIRSIEKYSVHQNTKKSWDLVNEVTHRKKANCGLIERGSAVERLKNWENHFVKLLGQPPEVPDEDIIIRTINPPLDINIDPFSSFAMMHRMVVISLTNVKRHSLFQCPRKETSRRRTATEV